MGGATHQQAGLGGQTRVERVGDGGGVDIEENELRGRFKEACRFTRRKLRLCGVEARKGEKACPDECRC